MSEPSITVYIGLGSNLHGPREQVERAMRELAELPDSHRMARSSLYLTRPVGPQDQPDYINAVVRLETGLTAEALHYECRKLERVHLRLREGERWGPRTLDLDLLLYADRRIATPDLIVPHPHIAERAFVLVPLADVAPRELTIPGQGRLGDLLGKLSKEGIRRLS